MKKETLIRLSVCLLYFGVLLFSYLESQNHLMKLRMQIPKLVKETKELKEEIARLQYEVNQFESPKNLMELAKSGDYNHLYHPIINEIVSMNKGYAVQVTMPEKKPTFRSSSLSMAVKMNP